MGASHFPATLGAVSTGLDAFIHSADPLATRRACLADLGTVHHQTKVFRLDVLAAGIEAMVHGGLQANLMATATSFYTGLHGVFSVGWFVHRMLLK